MCFLRTPHGSVAEDQRRAADRLPGLPGPALKKMLSMPGFRLSGNGWYETDFKTGAKKNLAGGDKAD
jgi:predicted nucleic acid-binding Zn ribbon protein